MQVSGASSQSVSTDANGRYTFDSLVPGEYRIGASGSPSGYGTKYHDDVYSFSDAGIMTVAFGDAVDGIDIQLGTSLIEFEIDSPSVDEDAGTATVWLNRRFGSSLTTTVRVFSVAGTATANVDYTGVDEIVTWEDGDAARKPVVVSITD